MNNFTFSLSTTIDFGFGSVNNLYKHIENYNVKKVLIVTDKNLAIIGILSPIIAQLKKGNWEYTIFDKVEPNPEIHIIDEGRDFAKAENCDFIIGIGGGSSIDTAKGISVMLSNSGSIFDYLDGRGEGKKTITNDPIPLIAIPTTSGTGSEVSMYAVITDESSRIKDSLTTVKIYPKVAIIDPELTFKLPPKVTAFTGLDVLGHALEAYTSSIKNALTDVWALEAIKLTFENLEMAVNNGSHKSRENMAFASLMAGSAMSHCGATIPHGLGCPLSGHLNLPHGQTVGILQIPMVEYNKEALKEEFYNVVKYVDPKLEIEKNEAADRLVDMIRLLLKNINVSEFLDMKLVDDNTMMELVEDAKIHGCTSLNRVELKEEDIKEIYRKILL